MSKESQFKMVNLDGHLDQAKKCLKHYLNTPSGVSMIAFPKKLLQIYGWTAHEWVIW